MTRAAVSALLVLVPLAANVYLAGVLAAVPRRHVVFVVLSAAYATVANAFILRTRDSLPTAPLQPRTLAPVRNSVRLLFPFTTVFSLLVPTALLAAGPPNVGPIVAPHLFLMLSQILVESIGHVTFAFYTLYVRLGVTIAYVSYRLPVILTWYEMAVAWARTEEGRNAPHLLPALAQAAAVLNLVYWSFALLCFLLLYCLPAVVREPVFVPKEEAEKKLS